MNKTAITPKVFLYAGQSWTDSLDIANNAGLSHTDVVQFIKNLELSRKFKKECFQKRYIDADGHESVLYWISRDGFFFLGEIFSHQDDPEEKDCIIFDKGTIRLIKVYIKALKRIDDKIFRGRLRRIKLGKC